MSNLLESKTNVIDEIKIISEIEDIIDEKVWLVETEKEFNEHDKWICKYIYCKEFKNVSHIKLINLELESLPIEILQLTNLQSLYLRNNQLKEFPEEISKLTNLQSLYLSSNQIKELPEEISKLTNLQSLYLRNNQLKELPEEISKLTNLQSLYLSDNQLKELPEEISKLTNLQSLYLSSNQIKELPEEISKLTNLQSLYLSDNQIKELPEEISKLTNLQSLDLSSNQIKEFPEEISKLTNLQSLYLRNNQIKELPEEISKLTNLQSLDLSFNQIKELPEEISKLTNLQSLYLSSNQIKELPEEISKLTNLQSLDLSDNQLKEFPEEISKLTNLQSLDLSDNQLKELPEEISKLTNLQSLDLSDNQLKEFPEEISKLTNLQSLDLSDNQLKEFPEEISKLTNLQSLDLSSNQIKEFPEEISKLTNLQSLDLRNNQLKEFPEEISKLTNLQSLYLSDNQLKELPEEISKLTNLQSLDLRNNQLKEFPEEISKLTNLQSLYLRNNQLKEFPEEISKLTNLQSLYLSFNQIKELPEEISKLTNLQSLDLRNNQIKELPEEISKLTNLQSLYLRNNQLKELPEEISKLTNLQSLDLSFNQLKELPEEISKLTNLQSLYLSYNKLKELPEEISKLTNLQRLNLQNNKIESFPTQILKIKLKILLIEDFDFLDNKGINLFGMKFKDVPVEVINLGKRFIILFLSYKRTNINEIKIIFIGDGAAGKTSLIKRFTENTFDKDEDTTHGIVIKDHEFEIKNENFISHMWDFGGQEIMHSTHQFFLSERCIYVLLLDGRKDAKVEYWLKHIESLGGDSKVFVVMNKLDMYPNIGLNEVSLRSKYKNIVGFEKISCSENMNIDKLFEMIKDLIYQMDDVRVPWPENWIGIKNKLESDYKNNKPYVDYNEYIEMCNENIVLDNDTQILLLKYLNYLGIVCSFDFFELQEKKVLNPNWITNGVYKIITSDRVKANNGYLEKNWINDIINNGCNTDDYEKAYGMCNFRYNTNEQIYILELMNKFELSYSIENSDLVLIPSSLNESDCEHDIDLDNSTQFVFEYEFLPKSIIHRLIIRNYKKIYNNKIWYTGVILSDYENNTKAFVKLDEEDKRIYIYIKGNYSRDLLSNIRDDFRDINSDFKFKKDEVKEIVVKNDVRIEYSDILGNIKRGNNRIVKGEYEFLISELLGDIESEDYTQNKLKGMGVTLVQTFNQTQENNQTQTTTQSTDVKNDIKIDIKVDLPIMQDAFEDFKDEVEGENSELDKELKKLDDEIFTITPGDEESKIKRCANKVARFFRKLEDEDSNLSKAIKGTKKGIEYAQKFGKAYNSIGQWAGLPHIPDLLLGEKK